MALLRKCRMTRQCSGPTRRVSFLWFESRAAPARPLIGVTSRAHDGSSRGTQTPVAGTRGVRGRNAAAAVRLALCRLRRTAPRSAAAAPGAIQRVRGRLPVSVGGLRVRGLLSAGLADLLPTPCDTARRSVHGNSRWNLHRARCGVVRALRLHLLPDDCPSVGVSALLTRRRNGPRRRYTYLAVEVSCVCCRGRPTALRFSHSNPA
jgi:hypothetical protein